MKKEIRTNRLVIEDSRNIDRIVLALADDDDEVPSIVINDRSGKPRFTLEVEDREGVCDVRLEMMPGKPGAYASFMVSSDGEAVGMLGVSADYKAGLNLIKWLDPGKGTVWQFGMHPTDELIDRPETIVIT